MTWSETEVRKVLADIEAKVATFTFNRIPDAHGGYAQPAVSDFQWFFDTGYSVEEGVAKPYTRNGIIEVKEVEHLTRLPHKNFGVEKIKRQKTRILAGSEPMVLIAHRLKGMRKPQVTWRCPPYAFFADTVYVKGVASWDLEQFPLVNMEEVLWSIVR